MVVSNGSDQLLRFLKHIERDKYFNQPAMITERLKHVETQLTNIYQWQRTVTIVQTHEWATQ